VGIGESLQAINNIRSDGKVSLPMKEQQKLIGSSIFFNSKDWLANCLNLVMFETQQSSVAVNAKQ